jgi:hypothetical protein
VPGIGHILSLVLLYEMHRIDRFPSVQEFASYGRLVKCSKESGGKRLGTSGAKIGNAHLKWAFSEAAVLFLRNNPQGQRLLTRLENKHEQGKALSILAHTLARAVYSMLKRKMAVDMEICLQTSGSRAAEPGAYLDTQRDEPDMSVLTSSLTASVNAKRRLGPVSLSLARCLDTCSGSFRDGDRSKVTCAAPPPSPALTGELSTLSQPFAWTV